MSMQRVVVVGTSCTGKTTFAKRLAKSVGGRHIELDAIHFGPNWTEKPVDEFRELVEKATRPSHWVVDGNYRVTRDIVWTRADTLVWLNYSFSLVWLRALRRTFGRCVTRQELFSGNRESFRKALLSRESILLWTLQTYWKLRREYRVLCSNSVWSHLRVIEHCRPGDAVRFLENQRPLQDN